MIEVELPDGTIVEFPAGTSKDVMKAALAKRFVTPATKNPQPVVPGGSAQLPAAGAAPDPFVEMLAGARPRFTPDVPFDSRSMPQPAQAPAQPSMPAVQTPAAPMVNVPQGDAILDALMGKGMGWDQYQRAAPMGPAQPPVQTPQQPDVPDNSTALGDLQAGLLQLQQFGPGRQVQSGARDVMSGVRGQELAQEFGNELVRIESRMAALQDILAGRIDGNQRSAVQAEMTELSRRRNQIALALGDGGVGARQQEAASEILSGGQRATEGAIRIEDLNAQIQQIPMNPAAERAGQAETFAQGIDAIRSDPLGVARTFGLRALPASAPSIVGGIVGQLALGPVGAAIGAGGAGFSVEQSLSVADKANQAFVEAGVDVNNPQAVTQFISQNPDAFSQIMSDAFVRAGIISAADAATAGLVGKIAVAVQPLSRVPRAATAAGSGLAITPAGEGAGEAAAQLATEGVIQPGEVLAEMAGGAALGGPTAVAQTIAEARRSNTPPQVQDEEPPASGQRGPDAPPIIPRPDQRVMVQLGQQPAFPAVKVRDTIAGTVILDQNGDEMLLPVEDINDGEITITPQEQAATPDEAAQAARGAQPRVFDAPDVGRAAPPVADASPVMPGAEAQQSQQVLQQMQQPQSNDPLLQAMQGPEQRSPARQEMQDRPASWVIRERETGEVVMETFDPRQVEALNTDRFEAVPIAEHLEGLNARQDAAQAAPTAPTAQTQENQDGRLQQQAGRPGEGVRRQGRPEEVTQNQPGEVQLPQGATVQGGAPDAGVLADLPSSDQGDGQGRNAQQEEGQEVAQADRNQRPDQQRTPDGASGGGGVSGAAQTGQQSPALRGANDPELNYARPLARSIAGMGGIAPRVRDGRSGEMVPSQAATELAARGITPRSHPYLFKQGGTTDLDNIDPDSIGPDVRFRLPMDGTGNYLDRDGLIQALENELVGGQPFYSSGETQAAYESREVERDRRRRGLTSTVDEDAQGERTITPREVDDAGDRRRLNQITSAVDEAISGEGLQVTDREKSAIVERLNNEGGYVLDVIESEMIRSVQSMNWPALQKEIAKEFPSERTDRKARRLAESIPFGDDLAPARPESPEKSDSGGAADSGQPATPQDGSRSGPRGNDGSTAEQDAAEVGPTDEQTGNRAWNDAKSVRFAMRELDKRVFQPSVPKSVQDAGQRLLDSMQAGTATEMRYIALRYQDEAGLAQGGGGAGPGKVKSPRRGVTTVHQLAEAAMNRAIQQGVLNPPDSVDRFNATKGLTQEQESDQPQLTEQSPPATERTDAGEQSVIPGAEQSQDQRSARMTDRQRAELEARQRQSKMRRLDGNTGDAGPLFDDQGDIFGGAAEPAAPKPRFPTTLQDIARQPRPGEGRLNHIYAEFGGARYYLASVPGNPEGPMNAWLETFPDGVRILSTDRYDGTSINGAEAELRAAIDAKAKPTVADAAQPAEAPARAEKLQDLGEKIGGARKDTAESGWTRKPKGKKDDRPAWQRRYEINEIVASITDGEKGKWVITDTKTNRQVRDGYRPARFDSEEDARKAVPLYEVARNHRVMKIGDQYVIRRRISNKKRVEIKGGFKTLDEANEYMAKNAVEIIETKVRIDDSIHPALDEAIRKGAERRKDDAPVGGQDFMEVFGFRGVEFGNWNNAAERQHLLNQAYDAFLDLAEIIRVPPKALSLNGDLALAFGARGQGLQGARAHYELGRGVINLTKIKGAGALAHEWIHAVDHYLARQDGKSPAEMKAQADGTKSFEVKSDKQDMASHGFLYRGSKVRPEVRDAFENVIKAMFQRRAEFTEDRSQREKIEERTSNDLDRKLDSFRKYLATAQSYGKKKDAATADQLKRVDAAIARIKKGVLGEVSEAPTKARFVQFMFHEPVMELAAVLKEVRGRQGYGMTQGRKTGMIVDLQFAIEAKQKADQFLEDAKQERTKTRTVRTEYYSEAWKMDQGTAKDYWSSNHEMLARGFEAFVYDRLKQIEARNDFLAYEKHNDLFEYKLFNVKPYPEGQERADINAAFEQLFDALQTRPTERGVEMYSRRTPLYSATLRAAEALPMAKGAGAQFLATLSKQPGVKREELEWLGIPDFLRGRDKVTRAELVEHIRANQVPVIEHRKGGAFNRDDVRPSETVGARYQADWNAANERVTEARERFDAAGNAMRNSGFSDELKEPFFEAQKALLTAEADREALHDRMVEETIDEMGGLEGATRYQDWRTRGGREYRELLLAMPDQSGRIELKAAVRAFKDFRWDMYEKYGDGFVDKMSEAEAAKYRRLIAAENAAGQAFEQSTRENYRSSHWDEPNVLAHIRFDERDLSTPLTEEQKRQNERRAQLQKQHDELQSELRDAVQEVSREGDALIQERKDELTTRYLNREITTGQFARMMEDVTYEVTQRPETEAKARLRNVQRKIDALDMVDEVRPETSRTLFIQEIQSDWHQAGRKKGYRGDAPPAPLTRLPDGHTVTRPMPEAHPDLWQYQDARGEPLGPRFVADSQAEAETHVLDQVNRARQSANSSVPDAPLKRTWHETAFRRAVAWAVEHGYDSVTWATGDMNAELFDLSQRIDRIGYTKRTDGFYNISAEADGEAIISEDRVTIERIEEVAGKEIAQKIEAGEGKVYDRYDGNITAELTGLDLKVGGEGMRGFYDKIIPSYAAKWGKRFGASVGKISLGDGRMTYDEIQKALKDFDRYPAGSEARASLRRQQENAPDAPSDKVWHMPITNAMRETVQLEGVALFRRGDQARPALNAKRTAMKRDLEAAWKRLNLPDDVRLRVVDRLFGMDPDGNTVPVDGSYVMGLAQVALDSTEGSMNTLHHEAIHMLRDPQLWGREFGLFTEAEWRALEKAASENWIEKHRIKDGYPDLDPISQVEEAIAAEFAEAWAAKRAPSGGLLVQAFNKISRFIKALGAALRGAGFRDPRSVFDAILSGEIGARGQVQGEGQGGERFSRTPAINTKAFRDWFGDSKVVDAEGKPLVVYHATDADFEAFDFARLGEITRANATSEAAGVMAEAGVWANTRDISGDTIQGRSMPVYMAIENPLVVSFDDLWSMAEGHENGAAMRDALVAEGYDGLAVDDTEFGGTSYVAFSPTQIKSVNNRGTFDPTDPRILYSRRPTPQPRKAPDRIKTANERYGPPGGWHQPPLPMSWTIPDRSGLRGGIFAVRETVQDQFVYLRAAQANIEAATGQPLTDKLNAAQRETLFPARVAERLDRLFRGEVKDFFDAMNAAAKRKGITRDDLWVYMVAKHAPERNAEMAKRDPKRFGKGNGSGLLDAAAADLLAELGAEGKTKTLEALSTHLRKMLNEDLKQRRAAGLISDQQYQDWRKMYQHYVPLRGFAERDEGGQVGRLGSGFDMRGKEVRTALGRVSVADDPISQIIAMRQEGIIRAEKNRVGKSFLDLVQKYPAPGLWEVMGKLPTKQTLDKKTGMVRKIVDFTAANPDKTLAVKVDGEKVYIQVDDPRLLEAFNNLGGVQARTMMQQIARLYVATGGTIMRYLGAILTSLNPNFVFANLTGDAMEAAWTAYNVDKKGMVLAYAKAYPMAMYSGFTDSFATMGEKMPWFRERMLKRYNISPKQASKWDRYIEEWKLDGGKINFMGLRDMDEIAADIDREVRRAGRPRLTKAEWRETPGIARDAVTAPIRGGVAVLEMLNQPIESGTRLAMYVAARENGLSREQAAALSLDSTTNFYRRGQGTKFLRATFLFINPAIQSLEKLARFSAKPRNWLTVFPAMIAMGVVPREFAKLMEELAYEEEEEKDDPSLPPIWRDPDGVPLFDKIPQFDLHRNITFPTGIEFKVVTMPDGQQYRVPEMTTFNVRALYPLRPLLALGTETSRLIDGQTDPAQMMKDVGKSAVVSWSPLTGPDPIAAVTPTLLQPAGELIRNENFFGAPINPDDTYGSAEGLPDSEQYFERRASAGAVEVAQFLNRVTGGDKYSPGLVDVYPGTLDHYFRFVTGGLGVFAQQTGGMIADRAAGVETDLSDTPVLRSMFSRTGGRGEATRYYAEREEVDKMTNLVRAAWDDLLQDPDDDVARDRFTSLAAELNIIVKPDNKLDYTQSLKKVFDEADDAMAPLREQLTGLKSGDGPRKEAAERVKLAEEQIAMIQRLARDRLAEQRAANTERMGEAMRDGPESSVTFTPEEIRMRSDFAASRRSILDSAKELRDLARQARENPGDIEAARRRDEMAARMGASVMNNGNISWAGSVDRRRREAQEAIADMESRIEGLRRSDDISDAARENLTAELRRQIDVLRREVVELGRGL